MHELSIALSIVDGVAEECARRGAPAVLAVHLRLGPLAGVVAGYLRSAWEIACEGSVCAGARLQITEVPLTIRCGPCGQEQEAVSLQEMRCRACDTPSADVVRGAELLVVGLEFAREPRSAQEDSRV